MNNIVRKIYREKTIKNIQSKIDMLGSEQKIKFDALTFLNTRLIATILVIILLVVLKGDKYYIIPFIAIAFYYLYYYLFITYPINKRIKKLDKEALTFFEILTLTLESGRNLENALEITVNNIDSELSNEFKKCLMEIKFGRSLMEALENLKNRIPSKTINNIILNIIQTNVFGNSIVSVMNDQLDYLREKQIMEIKGIINKIPNKVSIISVIFIIPLILLIILGPFLIELL